MTERFGGPDGRRIAFADTGGDGPVVLCLNGLTRTMAEFEALAERLAPRHRVIRMDCRGRGASDWADDPLAEYTVPVEGADAAALLAHLGIARAAIVGTSRGGLIGMMLAAGQPGLVTALVLNDIGPAVERAGLDVIMTYLGRDPGFADFAEAVVALQRLHGEAFVGLSDEDWQRFARLAYAERGGRPVLGYDPRLRDAVAAALEAPAPDLWALFEAIRAPVLAIRGANSTLLAAETLLEMAKRVPGMVQVTVPDRGHVPFLDEPEAVAAIDAFLGAHAR